MLYKAYDFASLV